MSDAIDRLKNRARVSVPARNSSLVQKPNDVLTQMSHSESSLELNNLDERNADAQKKGAAIPFTALEVSDENEPTASTSEIPDLVLPQVVRRTIRLEENIDEELENLCKKNKITKEVFLEASYSVALSNPTMMNEVIKQAKLRYQRRKNAGEKRKFMTMKEKFD